MKLSYHILTLAALAACSHPVPVVRATPETAVAASFAKTWDALITYTTSHQMPIKSTDRASGLLITEMMSLESMSPNERHSLADCSLMSYPVYSSATFVVRGDSTRSTVRATASLTSRDGRACTSANRLEDAWEREVKALAEKP